MRQLGSVLGDVHLVVQLAVFAVVTAQVARVARRHQHAVWVAAAFGALTAVSAAGLLVPDEILNRWHEAGRRAQVVLVAAIPYFVWRFAVTIGPVPRLARVAVTLVATALMAGAVALPELPADAAAAMSAGQRMYLVGFLVYWPVTFAVSAVLLWRVGDSVPALARQRMRLLAVGALALGAALLLSAADWGPAVLDVTVIGAGLAFYLGFVPPSWLKAIWRQRPRKGAQDIQTRLMAAATRQQVARAQVPYLHELIGLPVVVVDPDGHAVAAAGIEDDEARTVAERIGRDRDPEGMLVRTLEWGRLVVIADFQAPLFADEERELVDGMVHQLNLGLDRARLYDEERAARDAAERARGEIRALLAGIVHDVKNPTATISGYVDLLRDEWRDLDRDEIDEFLTAVARAADNLSELAGDLVELARADSIEPDPQPVDLYQTVRQVADDVTTMHQHLTVEVDNRLPVVDADPGQFRQLFTNLLTNAAIHGHTDTATVTVTCEISEEAVVVHVTDDGPGIPPGDLDRIFDLFTRGKNTTEQGSGVGLSICRRIVRTAGGTITATNTDDGGSCFTITLPNRQIGDPATH